MTARYPGAPTWRSEALILDACRPGPISMAAIVARSGLSKMAAITRVAALAAEGHLVKGRSVQAGRVVSAWTWPGVAFPAPLAKARAKGPARAKAPRSEVRENDLLTVLLRDGQSPTDLLAEAAGYRKADVIRSLYALEADGVVFRHRGRYWVEWDVAS